MTGGRQDGEQQDAGRRRARAPTLPFRPAGACAPAVGISRSSEELLARYRRKPDSALRNELIERHRPEVESMARRLATRLPRSVDVDDLTHAGLWGLVQAIDKFRADHGAPFRPFMRPRVRGAMLDELRNMDFLPRLYRQRARELDAAALRLRERLGREPSDAELAHELGISEGRMRATYARVHDTRVQGGWAEDGDLRGRSSSSSDRGDPFDGLADEDVESPIEALNRQDLLSKIEASLQPIEWTVLRMHYLEGLSGKEVAERLRLSAGRICQIHLRVLSRLKVRLASLPR
jgi:RNA polymerase sigma factor for flagellar operon FliA